ncbi:hypothetical protein BKA62DRAFT_324692 [Auriculariales sp. MPI-PUGE-AT-0066]|nr:hypothetical protein BKA62DRAFT_324692 [Auriculariales sp. MPI-PUGE-AT-0066]
MANFRITVARRAYPHDPVTNSIQMRVIVQCLLTLSTQFGIQGRFRILHVIWIHTLTRALLNPIPAIARFVFIDCILSLAAARATPARLWTPRPIAYRTASPMHVTPRAHSDASTSTPPQVRGRVNRLTHRIYLSLWLVLEGGGITCAAMLPPPHTTQHTAHTRTRTKKVQWISYSADLTPTTPRNSDLIHADSDIFARAGAEATLIELDGAPSPKPRRRRHARTLGDVNCSHCLNRGARGAKKKTRAWSVLENKLRRGQCAHAEVGESVIAGRYPNIVHSRASFSVSWQVSKREA